MTDPKSAQADQSRSGQFKTFDVSSLHLSSSFKARTANFLYASQIPIITLFPLKEEFASRSCCVRNSSFSALIYVYILALLHLRLNSRKENKGLALCSNSSVKSKEYRIRLSSFCMRKCYDARAATNAKNLILTVL